MRIALLWEKLNRASAICLLEEHVQSKQKLNISRILSSSE